MKRKHLLFIVMVLLMTVIAAGCSQDAVYMRPYAEKESLTGYDNGDNLVPAEAGLFAEDLCVIPVNSDKDKDKKLKGKSSLLVDITEQKQLYADNIYAKVYPASVTKILTTLVVLKYGNLEDIATVSKEAANITEWGAVKMGINEGDKISLDALLTAFLMYSGNDAGIALGEHVGGSVEGFAKMMNEEAKRLGATDSNFVNPHGLHDENHYTTAYDMYLIFNEVIHYEKFLKIINLDQYKAVYEDKNGNKIEREFKTTNRFLNGRQAAPEGITVFGGKTGTTQKAGSCLVLYSKDAKDHEYLSLLFKTENADALFSQMSYLLKQIKQ